MFIIASTTRPVVVGSQGGRRCYTVKVGKRWIVRLALWLFAGEETA